MIVEGQDGLGEETTFDFKYIPDLQKTTVMEESDKTGLKHAGIERRNLQALIIGCGVFGFVSILGVKLVSRAARVFIS